MPKHLKNEIPRPGVYAQERSWRWKGGGRKTRAGETLLTSIGVRRSWNTCESGIGVSSRKISILALRGAVFHIRCGTGKSLNSRSVYWILFPRLDTTYPRRCNELPYLLHCKRGT